MADPRLKTFLYLLMRDSLVPGEVRRLINESKAAEPGDQFSAPELEALAARMAGDLTETDEHGTRVIVASYLRKMADDMPTHTHPSSVYHEIAEELEDRPFICPNCQKQICDTWQLGPGARVTECQGDRHAGTHRSHESADTWTWTIEGHVLSKR